VLCNDSLIGCAFLEGFVEHLQAEVYVMLGDAHGRFDTEHIPVEATLPDQQAQIFDALKDVCRLC